MINEQSSETDIGQLLEMLLKKPVMSQETLLSGLGWTEVKYHSVLGEAIRCGRLPYSERGLYGSIGFTLKQFWATRESFKEFELERTSSAGQTGVWTRPDFVLIGKREITDSRLSVELITFEIKSSANFDVKADFEAVAQSEGATRS